MDSANPSSTTSGLLRRDDRLQAVRRRNKALILIFFSLIIVLALITGAIIVSVVQKIVNSHTPETNPAIREFCSVSYPQFFCINSLSSAIKTQSNTNPDQILSLSLQASLKQLSHITATASNLTRPEPEPALANCFNSMGQLNKILDLMRVHPELETRDYEQMRDMSEWIHVAEEDLARCVSDLGKIGSTMALSGVIEVRALVGYSKVFLANSDVVNENFRFGLENDGGYRNRIVEDLVTVSLFGSHYFVLLFLFYLLLRIY